MSKPRVLSESMRSVPRRGGTGDAPRVLGRGGWSIILCVTCFHDRLVPGTEDARVGTRNKEEKRGTVTEKCVL